MVRPLLKMLPTNLIRVDADTQSRAAVCWETIAEYAEAWSQDTKFPPLDVFCDETGDYFLADGFHRYLAAKRVAKKCVPCRVFFGNSREAFLFACTANQTHGLRRTNVDKRHMVARFLSDPEWVQWTDSRIAEQCGVSHTFVASVRHEHEAIAGSAAARFKNETRRGVDGKSYPPERKSRSRSSSIPYIVVKHESQIDRRQTKALTILNKLAVLLKNLGIHEKHAQGLAAIERDIRDT
jgi:hypothetical protein